MSYGLDNRTKKHVRDAADHFGKKYKINTIGGWRAGSDVPNSDHPRGLALDYMTRSKATGDALVQDLIDNHKAWGVKYIIWWRQVWSPEKGWRPYTLSNPHTDHVHASFHATPGTGRPAGDDKPSGGVANPLDPLGVAGAIQGVGKQLGTLTERVGSIGAVADLITRAFLPTSIVRGIAGLSGAIFILIGIWFLSREVRNG